MAQYPLLRLPDSITHSSPSRGGGGNTYVPLQGEAKRLQFEKIDFIFEKIRKISKSITIQVNPSDITPERALVFIVKNTVSMQDFVSAINIVDDLELLRTEEIEYEENNKLKHGYFYASMPSNQSLKKLLQLWDRRNNLQYREKKWGKIFEQLEQLRAWGPEDRISNESIDFWRNELNSEKENIRIELELWFYKSSKKRKESLDNTVNLIEQVGGKIIHKPEEIEAIAYQGILCDLPKYEISKIINNYKGSIAKCDNIIFVYPQSIASTDKTTEEAFVGTIFSEKKPKHTKAIVGLIDGMPMESHPLLNNFITVDDPDNRGANIIVNKREHGTQMASLIIHGDLNDNSSQIIEHSLYASPIIFPSEVIKSENFNETSSEKCILVDTFYRTILRMKEGEKEIPPTASDAFIVNISIAYHYRNFCNFISPWARLLDFLSHKYKILFLVSAGNITEPLLLKNYRNWAEFENASNEQKKQFIAKALEENKAFRTLLSPAESCNSLTIGSKHEDNCNLPARSSLSLDPYPDEKDFPNVTSALGLGFRRAIKPDIFFPGGKEFLTWHSIDPSKGISVKPALTGYGLKCAAAPSSGFDLYATNLANGTSAATALATHHACRLFEVLKQEQNTNQLFTEIPDEYNSVVIKALLMHCAEWPKSSIIFSGNQENKTRYLGGGSADINKSMSCDRNRATLIGCGKFSDNDISEKKICLHSIPLPDVLKKYLGKINIIITLAWFSPINTNHQDYKGVQLSTECINNWKDNKNWKKALRIKSSKNQPGLNLTKRGTIFHIKYENIPAKENFGKNNNLQIIVTGKEKIPRIITEPILYGLAITIKTQNDLSIYNHIQAALTAKSLQPLTA